MFSLISEKITMYLEANKAFKSEDTLMLIFF